MISKTLCFSWIATVLIVTAGTAAFAQGSQGGLLVTIKNTYEVDLNFGPLGTGRRKGTDTANGMLTRQGSDYVGTFSAKVGSNQNVFGPLQSGCTGRYDDSQNLMVVGRVVNGFPLVNNRLDRPLYNVTSYTGSASNEFLLLEFVPTTRTASQPARFDPVTNQLSVQCHDLIIPEFDDPDEDDSRYATRPRGFDPGAFTGIAFLPFNDTRWTTKGQGYIIRLPTSGILVYRDVMPPGTVLGLFTVKESVWTISVERQK